MWSFCLCRSLSFFSPWPPVPSLSLYRTPQLSVFQHFLLGAPPLPALVLTHAPAACLTLPLKESSSISDSSLAYPLCYHIFLVNGGVPSLSRMRLPASAPPQLPSAHFHELSILAALIVWLFAYNAASWPFLLATTAPLLEHPFMCSLAFPMPPSLQNPNQLLVLRAFSA